MDNEAAQFGDTVRAILAELRGCLFSPVARVPPLMQPGRKGLATTSFDRATLCQSFAALRSLEMCSPPNLCVQNYTRARLHIVHDNADPTASMLLVLFLLQ